MRGNCLHYVLFVPVGLFMAECNELRYMVSDPAEFAHNTISYDAHKVYEAMCLCFRITLVIHDYPRHFAIRRDA
jgi:hypothetical protein